MRTTIHDRAIEPLLKWQWGLPEPLQFLTAFPVTVILLVLLALNFAEAVVRTAWWRP